MYGRCPGCATWDSLQEIVIGAAAARAHYRTSVAPASTRAQPLADIALEAAPRISIPIEEFNRVLGGGIVPGSIILLGGDPGIGKSTLLLQMSQLLTQAGATVLYTTAEESLEQVRMRADRVGDVSGNLSVLAVPEIDQIIEAALSANPTVLIVDSIQAVRTADLESGAGTVSQVRECASRLVRLAKETGVAVFLVGHVTKDGSLAGPKVLEHMVDVVLYLEGDSFQSYRILRGVKNRYGATHEIGVFDMHDTGLAQVTNPSALFLTDHGGVSSGSAIAVTLEGTRALLVEIQALSTKTSFGLPRRAATGVDINRLHMLTAVLAKRAHIDVSTQDIYVNVVGGLKLADPATDLATVLAIYSSHRDIELPRGVAIGEVGLGGEVRPVQFMRRRVVEAQKLGIKRALVPAAGKLETDDLDEIDVVRVDTVTRAIEALAKL